MVSPRSCFSGRHIAVLGARETGRAAALVLADLGAHVILSDAATEGALGADYGGLRAEGVDVRLGVTPEAALDGADLVVTSPGIPADAPVHTLALGRGLTIMSEIEVAYLISQAPMVAVTGTNGKSTTAAWLGQMLQVGGIKSWVAGNIAADELKMPLISAAAQAAPNDAIVAEVSSFQLEWVERFRPRVGILTNVTPDHGNRHGSFADYAAAKSRMFAAQRPEDVAVLNAVNGPARLMSSRLRSRLMWFDRVSCCTPLTACLRSGQIVVRYEGTEYDLGPADALRLPGAHNVENALAAAGAAIAMGARPAGVKNALATFGGIAHRMEAVATRGGVQYINNSMCTNVDAAVRSMAAVGRPLVVIAGGEGKGADFAPLGPAVARYVRHLVLMGRDAGRIEEAVRAAGFTAIEHAASLVEAVTAAREFACEGDVVMLAPACASHDMFANFEARGRAFRDAVNALPE